MTYSQIQKILGSEAEYLLKHTSVKITQDRLHAPSPTFVQDIFRNSNRSPQVISNLERLFNHGRLAGTGYTSILPVDQGIEHSAGYSFAANPDYFDPENIIKLAIEGGCNAIASTYGVLAMMSKKYADTIPFIVKLNHNELLSYPNGHDQIMFASVRQAYDLGAVAVGATIYFGSHESHQQIQDIRKAFEEAHELGMATILWCYTRNPGFKKGKKDHHTSADISGQAVHLGATLGADIVKQKLPTHTGGMKALSTKTKPYAKVSGEMYDNLVTDHPIDLTRFQVANAYMGRVGLINSGGPSSDNDLHDAVWQAVVNKRAGGMGLILGRKAFKKPLKDGIKILNAVQDVYLCDKINLA
jgi:class I fructose-bisphosphate aldolase